MSKSVTLCTLEIAPKTGAIDIGAVCEALVYYDQVLLETKSPKALAEFVNWFVKHKQLNVLHNFLSSGALVPYHFNFGVGAYAKGDCIQGLCMFQPSAGPGTSEINQIHDLEWLIGCGPLKRLMGMGSKYKDVKRSLLLVGRNIGPDNYHPALRNAEEDFVSPYRCSIYLKHWLSREYARRNLQYDVPGVEVSFDPRPEMGPAAGVVRWQAASNVQLELNRHGIVLPEPANLLAGIGDATRLVFAARTEAVDLFVRGPLVDFCADKIAESYYTTSKASVITKALSYETEFPDIRSVVVDNKIDPALLKKIRDAAINFRKWLHVDVNLDKSVAMQYHKELASQSGLGSFRSRVFKFLRFLGGPVVGQAVAAACPTLTGRLGGVVANASLQYLADVGQQMNKGWRPSLFGEWVSKEIDRYLKEMEQGCRQPISDDSRGG